MSPTTSDSRVELVLLAQPRGFCAGVEMAIKALAWMVRTFPAPVYCYHEIVHNKLVVDRFVDQGVVFVDDIADVPVGSPIMLSAHGSAPEVVEAARSRGSYVVDSVCPLVTKVHHEVKVRAGKGYRIVYVGHDGHEEAIGTMAVAPDSIDRVESVEEVDQLEHVRSAGGAARPDHAVAPRLGGRCRSSQGTLPRRVDARPQRPVLRHDQPPGGAHGARAPLRCRRRDRIRRTRRTPERSNSWPARRAASGSTASTPSMSCPSTSPASSASPPVRRRRRNSSIRSSTSSLRSSGVELVDVTEEDEYFPPPRNIRELQTSIETASTVLLGGSLLDRPGMDDRSLGASDVLASLMR